MRGRSGAALVLALPISIAAAGLFALFARGGVRRFEHRAADEISSRLSGEHRKVELRSHIHGLFGFAKGDLSWGEIRASAFETPALPLFVEPDRPQSGHLGTLRLRLSDFRLAGLRVDQLQADIPECRYDFGLARREGKVRLSKAGIGSGSVELRQEDLGAFVSKKFREIKRAEVVLDSSGVTVSGYAEFILFKTNFVARCQLGIEGESRLVLTSAKIEFDGRPADPVGAEVLLKALNPVVDLDADLGLHGALRLRAIKLSQGRIRAEGLATIPTAPTEAPSPSKPGP